MWIQKNGNSILIHKSLPISWVYRMEGRSLSRYETKIAEDFNYSVIVSKKELELFKKIVPYVKNISAITNGIDTDYFNPSYNGNSVVLDHSVSEDREIDRSANHCLHRCYGLLCQY